MNMIDRYSRKVMRDIWSEQNKLDVYLKIELLNAKAWSKLGVVPSEDLPKLDKATFSIARVKEIEAITKHDVVAFTRAVGETLGEEKKWIHYGLTSTDVVDTANGYMLKCAN
jgi:adenylosuccinate lyase